MFEMFDGQNDSVTERQSGSPQPRVVSVDEAVSQHLSQAYWDWRAVFDRDPMSNPLQHPDVVLAELASMRPSPSSECVLIVEDSDGEARSVGVLIPKWIRTQQAGGLGPGWTLHGLRLAGGRFLSERESLDQLIRMIEAAARYCTNVGADFLLIEDLDEASLLHHAVGCDSVHGCRQFTSHDFQARRYVDFPRVESDYWATFSSRSMSKFRRNLKKLGRTRLERVTSLEQIPEFLRYAHEISRHSWQSRQFGLRIRNDESELRQLAALADNGMLRSYLWWVEDQPAAFAVCNQHQGCFRYEEIAYRVQFGQFSPGRTMLQQIVEDLWRYDPPRCLDFGGGDAEYKQQFANRESRSGTVWLVPPTWRAGLTLSYLKACRRIRAGFRSLVKQSGLGTRARQWVRSRGAAVTCEQESISQAVVTPAARPS